MVSGLTSMLEYLDVAAFLHGDLGEQVAQHTRVDESGATAGHENAIRIEKLQGQRLQPAVAAQRLVHRMASTGKLRRIKDEQVETPTRRREGRELIEDIVRNEGDLVQAVQPRVFARQRQCRLGSINAEHFAGAGASRVQA